MNLKKIKISIGIICFCLLLLISIYYLSLSDVQQKSSETWGDALGPIELKFVNFTFFSQDYRHSYFIRLQWKMKFSKQIKFMPGNTAYWHLYPFREVEFTDHE